jgi:hypothetical protein
MLNIDEALSNNFDDLIENREIEVRLYRYLQLNDLYILTNILLSTKLEEDRKDIMYIPDDYPAQSQIHIGWRLGNDGKWYPPEPPTEEEIINKEIQEITLQIWIRDDYEQKCIRLGIDPDTPEGRILLPEPVYKPPEQPRQEPILVTFARMAGILTPEMKAELSPIMPMSASIEPQIIPPKDELILRLRERTERLNMLRRFK